MKIAIISDTHDNLATLGQALEMINNEGAEMIIHCGDVCHMNTLKEIMSVFRGDIFIASGDPDDQELKEPGKMGEGVHICGKTGEIFVDNKRIAFTHRPEIALELAKNGQYDLVFHGHTHKPWEMWINPTPSRAITPNPRRKLSHFSYPPIHQEPSERCWINTCHVVNPGNLAGVFYRATFAIFDTKSGELSLKIL